MSTIITEDGSVCWHLMLLDPLRLSRSAGDASSGELPVSYNWSWSSYCATLACKGCADLTQTSDFIPPHRWRNHFWHNPSLR